MENNKNKDLQETIIDTIKTIWGNTLNSAEPNVTIKSAPETFDIDKQTIIDTSTNDSIPKQDQTIIDDRTQVCSNDQKTNTRVISPKKQVEFELMDELGRGGMGIVYLAHQKSLNRDIALKVIVPEMNQSEMKRRFISEAIITADLDHPNIVPVYTLTEDDEGNISIAMKKISGIPWSKILHPENEEEKKVAEKVTLFEHLETLLKVCDAIAFAHANKIVHRDLKPENIMIGKFGEVLVMDWGIAIDISEIANNKTMHWSEIKAPEGTPLYMAPEMALNEKSKIGVATDIYLMGAILHELVTGVPPHEGDSILNILAKASLKQEPSFLKDEKIPYELKKIMQKAMAYEPENRYSNVFELKQEIQKFIKSYDAMKVIDDLCQEMEDLKSASLWTNRDIYITGDHIYNGLEQVVKIVPENKKALDTIMEITQLQINWALKHEDMFMVDAYLDRLRKMEKPPQALIASFEESKKNISAFKKNIIKTFVAVALIFLIGFFIDMNFREKKQVESQNQQLAIEKEEMWRSFRSVQENYKLERILTISKDIRQKKKLTEVPLAQLRQNEIMTNLQIGLYEDASQILVQELMDAYPQQFTFDVDHFVDTNAVILEELKSVKSLADFFSILCEFSKGGWASALELVKIWDTAYPLTEDSFVLLKNLAKTNIICFAIENHFLNNKELASQEIKYAFSIDIPFVLWGLYTLSESSIDNEMEKYATENPLQIQRRNSKIFVTNLEDYSIWSFTTNNFLFFPENKLIYVTQRQFLLGLDVVSGQIVERHFLQRPIKYLWRTGKNSFAIECSCSYPSLENNSEKVEFHVAEKTISGSLTPDYDLMTTFEKFKLTKMFFTGKGISILEFSSASPWSENNFDGEKFLTYAEECIAEDTTNEISYLIKAFVLHKKGQKEEAEEILKSLSLSKQLTAPEFFLIGAYCQALNIEEAALFYEITQKMHTKAYFNPDLAFSLISTPAIFVKKIAEEIFLTGKEKEAFAILDKLYEIFGFSEGDSYVYRSLYQWAKKNNEEALAQKFYQRFTMAEVNGGGLIGSNHYILIADALIPFNSLTCLLLTALIVYFWFRARNSRIIDLEAIGFHNVFLRNAAFFTHPFKRMRYTFISYLNIGERVSMIFIVIFSFISLVILTAIISRVGVIAALPIQLGNGYIGSYTSMLYLQGLEEKGNKESCDLLMAEGYYAQENIKEAEKHWQATSLNPIASNNLGVLYSANDFQKAQGYFKYTIANGDELQQKIANINLQMLEKKQIPNNIDLPMVYKNRLATSYEPLIILCNYSHFDSSQGDKSSLFYDTIAILLSGKSVGDLVSNIVDIPILNAPLALWEKIISSFWLFFIILLIIINSFFTPVRTTINTNQMKEIHLVMKYLRYCVPGIYYLLKKQGIRSFVFFMCLISCLCVFFLYYFNGGILTSITAPAFPFSQNIDDLRPLYLDFIFAISMIFFLGLLAISIRRSYAEKNKTQTN